MQIRVLFAPAYLSSYNSPGKVRFTSPVFASMPTPMPKVTAQVTVIKD